MADTGGDVGAVVSIFMRPPRPWPSWRRARSRSSASRSSWRPAGSPSTMQVESGPCDSPAVISFKDIGSPDYVARCKDGPASSATTPPSARNGPSGIAVLRPTLMPRTASTPRLNSRACDQPDDHRQQHVLCSGRARARRRAWRHPCRVRHARAARTTSGRRRSRPRPRAGPAHRTGAATRPITSAAIAAGNVTRFLIRRSSRSVIVTRTSTAISTKPEHLLHGRVVHQQVRDPQRDQQNRAGNAQRLAAPGATLALETAQADLLWPRSAATLRLVRGRGLDLLARSARRARDGTCHRLRTRGR